MSELINNREYRKQVIKEILLDLHRGKSVEEVKPRFDAIAATMDPAELSLIEQSLIDEGIEISEIQSLCDVHAAVFKEALSARPAEAVPQGHPLDVYRDENRALERLIAEEIAPLLEEFKASSPESSTALALHLAEKLNLLWDVDKHYSRKENLIFPFLENYGITAPPKVMWGVDDEIRTLLKGAKRLAINYRPADREQLIAEIEKTTEQIREMIFKENKILFPMLLETLNDNDWLAIQADSDQIGYCLIEPQVNWRPAGQNPEAAPGGRSTRGGEYVKFATGVLTPGEIEQIFNHLPIDITFVDKEGIVKFFSASKERIFHRTKTIIGRKVENCHPPASVHVVEQIAADLKSGQKDQESFWIKMGNKFVHIQYFAVRDEQGEFLGILEATQNIQPLQQITGEKRIMAPGG